MLSNFFVLYSFGNGFEFVVYDAFYSVCWSSFKQEKLFLDWMKSHYIFHFTHRKRASVNEIRMKLL